MIINSENIVTATVDLTETEALAMDNIVTIVNSLRHLVENHHYECVVNPTTGEVIDIDDLKTVARTLDYLLYWDGNTYDLG